MKQFFCRSATVLFIVFFVGVYMFAPTSHVHAQSTSYMFAASESSVHPYVPGCLPWIVSEKTSGNFVTDLEEDNCSGYYAVSYFTNSSVANFHVYISAGYISDSKCSAILGYTSCSTVSVGYSGNSNNQICFYGEGGVSTYTNQVSGCVGV